MERGWGCPEAPARARLRAGGLAGGRRDVAMSASLVRATVRAVSKRKLQPTRAALTLTPSAVNKIKQLLKDKPEHVGLKVGVRTRGCNGLSYTLEYTKTKGDSDEEVIQDGVRVFIEKKAQLTLLGTEMDYVEDKLSSEFVFNNPNIKGTCGCGESFNIWNLRTPSSRRAGIYLGAFWRNHVIVACSEFIMCGHLKGKNKVMHFGNHASVLRVPKTWYLYLRDHWFLWAVLLFYTENSCLALNTAVGFVATDNRYAPIDPGGATVGDSVVVPHSPLTFAMAFYIFIRNMVIRCLVCLPLSSSRRLSDGVRRGELPGLSQSVL